MKILIICEFNIDTACVKLKYSDGSVLDIDCDAVEDEYAKTIRQRSALDYLVYNAHWNTRSWFYAEIWRGI